MKHPIILTVLFFITSFQISAQSTDKIAYSQFNASGGTHLQIVGAGSDQLADAMFSQFPDTKRNGYVWKFKKVSIPGISEPVTLQVHQGLYGTRTTKSESSCCNETYFHTFDNEKYKQRLLAQQKDTEEKAILIYVKRGRNYNAASKEEVDLIKSYLSSLI